MDKQTLNDYLKRSGDKKLPEGDLIENENGFCVYGYALEEEAFVLIAVHGDGMYWNEWAEDMAKSEGLKKIICATRRNPAGFVRRHGYHVAAHLLERMV